MNKREIASAYRVRFGRVTIDKEIGRGGKGGEAACCETPVDAGY